MESFGRGKEGGGWAEGKPKVQTQLPCRWRKPDQKDTKPWPRARRSRRRRNPPRRRRS